MYCLKMSTSVRFLVRHDIDLWFGAVRRSLLLGYTFYSKFRSIWKIIVLFWVLLREKPIVCTHKNGDRPYLVSLRPRTLHTYFQWPSLPAPYAHATWNHSPIKTYFLYFGLVPVCFILTIMTPIKTRVRECDLSKYMNHKREKYILPWGETS